MLAKTKNDLNKLREAKESFTQKDLIGYRDRVRSILKASSRLNGTWQQKLAKTT